MCDVDGLSVITVVSVCVCVSELVTVKNRDGKKQDCVIDDASGSVWFSGETTLALWQ